MDFEVPSNLQLQFVKKIIPEDINKEFKERDLILFCRNSIKPFGAVVFPMKPNRKNPLTI